MDRAGTDLSLFSSGTIAAGVTAGCSSLLFAFRLFFDEVLPVDDHARGLRVQIFVMYQQRLVCGKVYVYDLRQGVNEVAIVQWGRR